VSSVDKNAGFTIVETLIVLAVTSALMVAFMITMGGKQARTEFAVGSRQLLRTFQSQIGQISSGNYDKTFTGCSGTASVIFGGGATDMGSSSGCVYLGKSFVLGGAPDVLRSYVVAGLRTPAQENSITSYSPTVPPLNTSTRLPAGFSFENGKIDYGDGTNVTWSNTQARAFWVLRDVSSISDASASIQPLAVYGAAASYTWSGATLRANINAAPLTTVSKVQLCFRGGTGKFVVLSVGQSGGATVTSEVKDTCAL